MITREQAVSILDRTVRPGEPERVSLWEAEGRVLAEPVRSDVDWPPFDTSAMDGYAVRLEDFGDSGGGLAERPGAVGAGAPVPLPIARGEAVRVMTGAALPPGTEAIVPVEEAERRDGRVLFRKVPAPGAHLRRRGESVAAGSDLLAPGQRLTSASVALAALAGADPIAVHRRPRVAIAVTGNELVATSAKPGAGQLRDSNGPMLAALCRDRGLEPVSLGRISDDAAGLAGVFGGRRADELDLLITSGGVSAGDFDLVPAEAERHGFEILFHRIAVRPGKPIAFGRRANLLWFGLPGNPVSASVGFHLFVRHALDRLEGLARPGAALVEARLSREAKAGARETWRDAVLSRRDGELRVEVVRTQGSHDIAAHARANALARIPAGEEALPAGSFVSCLELRL